MKKIALVAIAVFFVNIGMASACQYCRDLERLGYSKSKIAYAITASANHEEAKAKLQRLAAKGMPEPTVPFRVGQNALRRDNSFQVARAETISKPTQERVVSDLNESEQVAGQIIVATMADAPILLAPTNQVLQEQKESVSEMETAAKQAESRKEAKKKEQSQKVKEALWTTTIIGTAFIPVAGPFIASGLILGRVGWGLLPDSSEENQ